MFSQNLTQLLEICVFIQWFDKEQMQTWAYVRIVRAMQCKFRHQHITVLLNFTNRAYFVLRTLRSHMHIEFLCTTWSFSKTHPP